MSDFRDNRGSRACCIQERKEERDERGREHCSAHSPPLALKQQQEEREKESGREGGTEPQVRKRGEQQSTLAAG